jgi:hypothetical protein
MAVKLDTNKAPHQSCRGDRLGGASERDLFILVVLKNGGWWLLALLLLLTNVCAQKKMRRQQENSHYYVVGVDDVGLGVGLCYGRSL